MRVVICKLSNNLDLKEHLKENNCSHLEVTDFSTYYVKDYFGQQRKELLQKCRICGAYLALDGTEIAVNRLIESLTIVQGTQV